MRHVVFVRVGQKYSPEYVAVLSDMMARNLSELDDIQPWCVTDDPASVPEGVRVIAHNPDLPGWWQKVWLFSGDMPWQAGERVIYCDLDVVVTGRLEPLFAAKGIIRDWNWPGFNSSVMVWDHGEHRQVWDHFDPAIIDQPSADLAPYLPKGQINGGDQEWIAKAAPNFPILPPAWCVSYKQEAALYPPEGARIVVFHGEPKPHQVSGWVADFWKIGGFTELPVMDGANVSQPTIQANIVANAARDLAWFTGFPAHKDTAVICCGGPSLADSLADIRFRKRQGARIISVNNVLGFLAEQGLTPDSHVMLDARPQNAAFLAQAPQSTRYLVASQCDAAVFDALEGRDVLVWHCDAAGLEETLDALPNTPARPMIPVPGGGTVGLRAMLLAWMSGYRKIHIYGMDGSFRNGEHHAYPQPINDADRTLQVQLNGNRYTCARWMVRQANEFRQAYQAMSQAGVQVFVHGDGLIPDLYRALRSERLAA
jgi:hypothetical protein